MEERTIRILYPSYTTCITKNKGIEQQAIRDFMNQPRIYKLGNNAIDVLNYKPYTPKFNNE